jgi:small subunit ribosomal protein S6
MNKRYEALLALDTAGREDSVKDIVERIEKLFKAEGAEVEQVQRLERRELSYEHNHKKTAYFVNFIFAAEPQTIDKLRQKLKLDDEVAFQNYLVLPQKKKAATAAA